jgi:hypothetical protein
VFSSFAANVLSVVAAFVAAIAARGYEPLVAIRASLDYLHAFHLSFSVAVKHCSGYYLLRK